MNNFYNPRSKDYWGVKFWPMELEDERNNLDRELHKSVHKILNLKKFQKLRGNSNNLSDWNTPEERINHSYKQPGYWIVPPSLLSFFKIKYPESSKLAGEYKFPFYLLLNKELQEYRIDQAALLKAKKELNDELKLREIQKRIDELESEIEELGFELYEVAMQYAKYLIYVIASSADVEDYEYDRFTDERIDTMESMEAYYYGSIFGNEYAIQEKVDFFVKPEDREKHISLLDKLIPLTKEYLLYQITKEHFKRGEYGKWDDAKEIVEKILNEIGSIENLCEKDVEKVLKGIDANFIPPNGRKKFLKRNGILNKRTFCDAISDVLSSINRANGITGKHIEDNIKESLTNEYKTDRINFDCKYWN